MNLPQLNHDEEIPIIHGEQPPRNIIRVDFGGGGPPTPPRQKRPKFVPTWKDKAAATLIMAIIFAPIALILLITFPIPVGGGLMIWGITSLCQKISQRNQPNPKQ